MQLETVIKVTTAVDDIDRNEPTNTPSDNLAPLNCINGKNVMRADIQAGVQPHSSNKKKNRDLDITMAIMPHKNINMMICRKPPKTATAPTTFNCMRTLCINLAF